MDMTCDLNQFRADLTSENEKTRCRAATFVGNCGAEAAPLLPILMEMIASKLDYFENHAFGEFISAGRILHAIEELRESGKANESMCRYADSALERFPSFIESARGASASLLMYVLVLVGPRMAYLSPLVLNATLRETDRHMRYRAYQFACVVAPSLLHEHPWSTFPPEDDRERAHWGRVF